MINIEFDEEFDKLFALQKVFQRRMLCIEEGEEESPEQFALQIVQIIEELGELLQTDKRWRVYRGGKFDKNEKLEELADVFIVAMNLAIFSGIECEELLETIEKKIDKNFERMCGERIADFN